MTKQQEIEWLDQAIQELGPHTYLGASLADQRVAIAQNILNDFPALELQHLYQLQLTQREQTQAAGAALQDLQNRIRTAQEQLDRLECQIRDAEGRRRDTLENLRRRALEALADLQCYVTP